MQGSSAAAKREGEGRRYGGRTAEERRSERRERLIRAGLDLFGTRGYPNTTIEGICKATGLNPRYFYEQFDSREDLMLAVYERVVGTAVATMTTAVEAAPLEPRARIEAGLRAVAAAILSDERYPRIIYIEAVGVSAKIERRRRKMIRATAGLLEDQARLAAELGGLPKRDYRPTSIALMGAVEAMVLEWLALEPRPPIEWVVDELVALFVAAFTRPA